MKTSTWLSMMAVSVALAACGGGGGDDTPAPPATDRVPDSASASSTGMVAWLKRLAGIAPEDKEALDATRFAPPRPDDAEPETL